MDYIDIESTKFISGLSFLPFELVVLILMITGWLPQRATLWYV